MSEQHQAETHGPVVELQLHAIWYQVIAPRLVKMPNGAPAFDLIGAYELLAQAIAAVQKAPGARIVQNAVIHVQPSLLKPGGAP